MKAYIYRITNNVTGKSYIGQTIQPLNKRWSEHCNNSNCCKVLKHSIQKHGKQNFSLTVIEEIEFTDKHLIKEELNKKKMEYIAIENTLVPNGYNVNKGGNSAPGRRWKTPPNLGKKWTKEWRQNFLKARTGVKTKPKTLEQIATFVQAVKKPIKCNETGMIWTSVTECAEYFGVKPKQISRVLKQQRKRLKWQYTFSYLPKQS